MNCTFFGHRDVPREKEPILKSTLTDLIVNKDVNVFYVGNNGNFDNMVSSILSELSLTYPIKYYIVLAYLPKKESKIRNLQFCRKVLNLYRCDLQFHIATSG